MKGIGRYWGYLAFILLISGLWTRSMGPAALILLSGLVTFYFLLQAPLWCAAINRDGTLCRNNSSGLLLGCRHRQHKFQKLKMRFVPQGWARMNRDLWTSPRQGLATLGLLIGIFSGIAGVVLK
ncbi:hypothetical protein Q2K19_10555 [Micromonospora soli]|uniref:hypothetical protein n=1 Tax=Micromonospora sp. NBRC 110009 TaxID=3061627 RepID=UPI0026731E5F|nr:hypothetical protein [Micromonospora sp. NBRC 110009]WKU00878.1 hypothetical protein Q2K19_10555 [Micromonospora sp. NBRC 110009]